MSLRAICQLISTAEEALTTSSNGSGKQRHGQVWRCSWLKKLAWLIKKPVWLFLTSLSCFPCKCRLYLPLVAMAVGQILLKFGSKQELAWGQEQAFSVAEAFLAEMIDCYLCLLLVLHSWSPLFASQPLQAKWWFQIRMVLVMATSPHCILREDTLLSLHPGA